MSRKIMYSVLSGALLASAGIAQAQHAQEEAAAPPLLMLQEGVPGEGGPDGPFGPGFELLGFGGMHGGKVVKGAPFSATAVSEHTQTLADGNHITRKTQSNLFRDSQGRFRKEQTLPAFDAAAASGQAKSVVIISDPVAATGYMLETDKKIAFQMKKPGGNGPKGPDGTGDDRKAKFEAREQTEIADGTLKVDALGTQTIAGVVAQGTRRTRTIPAGRMGNDKVITIVSEQWYSNDLQLVVSSKHSDPRFGDSSYTLANIQRNEPAASLFTVPSDYTVKQGHGGRAGKRFRRGPGMPPPAPPAGAPAPPASN